MTKKKDHICPVTNALTILGGKWKINIIYQLSQKTIRFGELRRSLGSVTQQMLSKQLKEMEKDKLINKLENLGVETRPIISGNFLKQPSIKKYKIKSKVNVKNSNMINKFGLFIGLPINKITSAILCNPRSSTL